MLSIYKGKNSKIDFFVKNFNDINVIIFPMIESNNCKIYKKFESREKTKIKTLKIERKKKLDKIKDKQNLDTFIEYMLNNICEN